MENDQKLGDRIDLLQVDVSDLLAAVWELDRKFNQYLEQKQPLPMPPNDNDSI